MNQSIKTITKTLFTLLLIGIVFSISEIYKEKFNKPIYGMYSDNTAHTLTSTNLWVKEGPYNLNFLSILSYPSIQYENHDSTIHERHIGNLTFPKLINGYIREVYISYPTGYLLPTYIDSILSGEEPSYSAIFRINFIFSLLLVITLSFIALHLLEGKILLSLSVLVISILSVGYLYFFKTFLSYNSIGALYYAIFILFYIKKWNNCNYIVLFIGLITDYIFFFIALTYLFLLMINKNKKEFASVLIICFISLGLFIYQLHSVDLLNNILWKLQFRLGLIDTVVNYKSVKDLSELNFFRFTAIYTKNLIIVVGTGILAIPVILLLLKKLNKKDIEVLIIAIIPAIFYTLILRSSSVHEYEAIKFIPGSLIALSIIIKYYILYSKNIILIFIALNMLVLTFVMEKYEKSYEGSYERNQNNILIKENTTEKDIIFISQKDISIWNNRLTFKIAPYMWWRDNFIRERNLNSVESWSEINNRMCILNVKPDRVLLITKVDSPDINYPNKINKTTLIKNNNILIEEIKYKFECK